MAFGCEALRTYLSAEPFEFSMKLKVWLSDCKWYASDAIAICIFLVTFGLRCVKIVLNRCIKLITKHIPGLPSDLNTGNGTEGALVCTSLGSLLRPLFYFLCSNLKANPVLLFYHAEEVLQSQLA